MSKKYRMVRCFEQTANGEWRAVLSCGHKLDDVRGLEVLDVEPCIECQKAFEFLLTTAKEADDEDDFPVGKGSAADAMRGNGRSSTENSRKEWAIAVLSRGFEIHSVDRLHNFCVGNGLRNGYAAMRRGANGFESAPTMRSMYRRLIDGGSSYQAFCELRIRAAGMLYLIEQLGIVS